MISLSCVVWCLLSANADYWSICRVRLRHSLLCVDSCFLLAMQEDSIEGIYDTLKQCALISKNAGGVGLHVHCIRASGSFIAGVSVLRSDPVFQLSLWKVSMLLSACVDSAPSLQVYYFFVVDSVCACISVCHGAPSNCFFFFVSRWNRAIFWLSLLHVALYKTVIFDFWFRPLTSKIYSTKFALAQNRL